MSWKSTMTDYDKMGALPRRSKDEQYYPRTYPRRSDKTILVYPEDILSSIPKLKAAIDHARSVAKRQHIQADRVERISLFVTSLRTILKMARCEWAFILLNKRTWYDIGVLHPNAEKQFPEKQSFIHYLKQAIKQIQMISPFEDTSESIRNDMKELTVELAAQKVFLAQLDAINERAENVMANLENVLMKCSA